MFCFNLWFLHGFIDVFMYSLMSSFTYLSAYLFISFWTYVFTFACLLRATENFYSRKQGHKEQRPGGLYAALYLRFVADGLNDNGESFVLVY